MTIPVQPSYDTEAAQPHHAAQAGEKPSSHTPGTMCAPDNSLSLSWCVPVAWLLYPSLIVGNLLFHSVLHIFSGGHHSTLPQSYHQQETPVVPRQEISVVSQLSDSPVTGGKPM